MRRRRIVRPFVFTSATLLLVWHQCQALTPETLASSPSEVVTSLGRGGHDVSSLPESYAVTVANHCQEDSGGRRNPGSRGLGQARGEDSRAARGHGAESQ